MIYEKVTKAPPADLILDISIYRLFRSKAERLIGISSTYPRLAPRSMIQWSRCRTSVFNPSIIRLEIAGSLAGSICLKKSGRFHWDSRERRQAHESAMHAGWVASRRRVQTEEPPSFSPLVLRRSRESTRTRLPTSGRRRRRCLLRDIQPPLDATVCQRTLPQITCPRGAQSSIGHSPVNDDKTITTKTKTRSVVEAGKRLALRPIVVVLGKAWCNPRNRSVLSPSWYVHRATHPQSSERDEHNTRDNTARRWWTESGWLWHGVTAGEDEGEKRRRERMIPRKFRTRVHGLVKVARFLSSYVIVAR